MFHESQHGFVPNHSILEALWQIEASACKLGPSNARASAIFLDIVRAFPSVSHTALFASLRSCGAPHWLVTALSHMYARQEARFCISLSRDEPFPIGRGLKQGCPASGFLFTIVLDSVIRWSAAAVAPAGASLSAYTDDIACIVVLNRDGAMWIIGLSAKLAATGMVFNMSKVRVIALHSAAIGMFLGHSLILTLCGRRHVRRPLCDILAT